MVWCFCVVRIHPPLGPSGGEGRGRLFYSGSRIVSDLNKRATRKIRSYLKTENGKGSERGEHEQPGKREENIAVIDDNHRRGPELNKKRAIPSFAVTPTEISSERDTMMAVNIEMATPMPKTSAKPFTSEVPSQKRMSAVIIEEILESRIESQARAKPSRIPSLTLLPLLSSSFIRSNISTFASTAMPMERMNAAIPAAVSVTPSSLKIERTKTI